MSTTDEMTVTMSTENGSTGPIPMSEFGELPDRIEQLRFDVGGSEPNKASLKLAADLRLPRSLHKGSSVVVTITTPAGELLSRTEGKILSVNFKDEYDGDYVVGCDRIHTVKL